MADAILDRLMKVRRSGSGWTSLCPAHDDRDPSLTIKLGVSGVLLHCQRVRAKNVNVQLYPDLGKTLTPDEERCSRLLVRLPPK